MRDTLYLRVRISHYCLLQSCLGDLCQVLSWTWVSPIIWLVVGFAHEHLSVQSLLFPLLSYRLGQFPSCGTDLSLKLCISRSCHQGLQLSRFFLGVTHLSPGLTLWRHSLM